MNTKLPSSLEAKLIDFRRRVWMVKLLEGALAALFGIALSYLLVFALDRCCETPAWLRLLILLAGGSALGLGLPLKWHRWVWRQRRLEDAARLLRRTFPRLGDELLGIVELARRNEGTAGRSERLVQAAIAQTAEAVKDRDFTHAVPDPRHRQWGWAAGAVVGVAMLAFLLVNAAARNTLARWLMPWRHVERFTFANLEPLPSRVVVPYAESFSLPVRLSPGTRWSPGHGSGRIGGQPKVNAGLASGAYSFLFPPQKQDAQLALSVGDVRKSILVQPRTRPELAELSVRLRLPAYLGYKSEQIVEARSGSVNLLRGSQAAFQAKASRDLIVAEMDGQAQKVEGENIVTGYEPVAANAVRRFTWKDRDGLSPLDPLVLNVQAVDDEPPRIVASRESLDEVVLDSEVVTFDLSASDDFGVKEAGLEWTGSSMQDDGVTPVHGEKVSAAGEPEKKELKARATFCATREGVAPQTLEIRAWTVDYLPGRPHVHSATFVLHVLNKTDHAIWLTEQFGKWLEAAKESYEREQQLNQTNKELRALGADELDRPENRRKVSQQAAAENANASRLDNLTQSGTNLVEQATKNDEFDAKRLESWATMLKTLKDIAANRMPNVSDLLKQTAGASAGKLNGGNANAGGTPSSRSQSSPHPPQSQSAPIANTAPNASHGNTLPPSLSPAPPIDPNATPKPAAPGIADREPGFGKPPEPKAADPNAPPEPPGASHLGLPNTMLGAAPVKKTGDDPPGPPQSPAQATMDNALTEQKNLLAEFAKVSDQLSDILASLEASTFVKRLKAASRQQMNIASTINQKTLSAFGIEQQPVQVAQEIAKHAKEQSETVSIIQSDLDAYFERKQDARFKTILDDMRKTEIVQALASDGDKLAANLAGQSMTGSEYWADTLDRWAEELVAASNCKSSSCRGKDSLPPEIVLKVMQALRDEMKLRDETRETENARPATDEEKYATAANMLGGNQGDIGTHTGSAISDILALPDGAEKFGKELQLLHAVAQVMDESKGILVTPDTGPKAIAAETEAIELLLQAKRQSPNGGGGGGSNPGGGGRGATETAALSDLGPGSDAQSVAIARPVGQATGRAGKEFPDEFKTGLDTYFSLLEGQSAGK